MDTVPTGTPRADFERLFKITVAGELTITVMDVAVNGLSPGSVVLDFTVKVLTSSLGEVTTAYGRMVANGIAVGIAVRESAVI